MSEDAVFGRATGVVAATVDGDVVLMAPSDGRCFSLRGPAEDVWDLLASDRTIGQLVDELTDRYDVDEQRCSQDVTSLLADMESAGVVRRTGEIAVPGA